MMHNYTPTYYYSSLQDTITSLCKSILPFSLKNRRLPSKADQKLAKHQSENLKWQQESFHRIHNLIGLHKEGIVPEGDVLAFRSHLLDTLIASPADQEPPGVIRDKLIFLQELFYAKCISSEEYHSSKRPLLQRLAVQGVEINCKDVIVGGHSSCEEEWSVIELRDKDISVTKDKPKHRSPMKPIKGAMSMIGIGFKTGRGRPKEATNSVLEPFGSVDLNCQDSETRSILMSECPQPLKDEKVKKKSFHSVFHKEQKEANGIQGSVSEAEEPASKSLKKQWGFNGFKKWKRSDWEDESRTPYLPSEERSDDASSAPCALVASPIGEGPDTKRIKKKIHSDGSASDFFIDKVLGDSIKKELSRIQSELCTTNPNLSFSDDQIEAISTRLPVDKADLKKFFPKQWCDRYGDIVLDVVKKEFKDHVGEMEIQRNVTREKRNSSEKWVAFEENDENFHPNLFFQDQSSLTQRTTNTARNISKECYYDNPSNGCFVSNSFHGDQNPFWTPRGH